MDHIDRLRADGHKSTELDIKFAQCLLVTGREARIGRVLAVDPEALRGLLERISWSGVIAATHSNHRQHEQDC